MLTMPICYNIIINCTHFVFILQVRFIFPSLLLFISLFPSLHPSLPFSQPPPLSLILFHPPYMTVHLFFFFPSTTTSSAPGKSESSLISFTALGDFGVAFQGKRRTFGTGTYNQNSQEYERKSKMENNEIKWNEHVILSIIRDYQRNIQVRWKTLK